MSNTFIVYASVSTALAIILGAFGAHAIKERVSPKDFEVWNTASHYHLVVSATLFAIGLLPSNQIRLAFYVILLGMSIFSGSLYALVLSNKRILGAVTPIGGTIMIVGYVLLAIKFM